MIADHSDTSSSMCTHHIQKKNQHANKNALVPAAYTSVIYYRVEIVIHFVNKTYVLILAGRYAAPTSSILNIALCVICELLKIES